MSSTLLLDTVAWDLVLDADGNIAVASEPYSLAQDAASAIRTWFGEAYFDTTLGVRWGNIFGKVPNYAFIKQQCQAAAVTVPDVASAKVFLTSAGGRGISGQVQVTSQTTGLTSATNFTVISPQGIG
ncbi:hypothetical protein IC762_17830 [Bradyrhizobium genosp. L]|uniref:hypothetical protein n=1 Tax=Bradyrhizobium genosp. L TaxID=83637 RepID=UPI0018A335E8|nr:hypothetical protein [Bradyrhizobium genosp. L]QPF81683.1 hypothetical protein IC762_17830 [Bradyrhizobium genosp. L]